MEKKELILPYMIPEFPEAGLKTRDLLILNIQTTGRYWRSTYITDLFLIREKEGGVWEERHLTSSSDREEYDILRDLPDLLQENSCLITYNGTSFTLPYLQKKIRAYGLSDPFFGHRHRDLLKVFSPFVPVFGLASAKLKDMTSFLKTTGSITNFVGFPIPLVALSAHIE